MKSSVDNQFQHDRRDTAKDYTSVLAEGSLLDQVFALRYRAYVAEDYIEPNDTRRFFDEFDKTENCRSWLTYCGQELVGSIRACVYDPRQGLDVPVMEIFDRELREEVGYDKPFVEANKFVVAPEFQRRGGIRARFNMYRNIVDTAFETGADRIVVAVRPSHIKFYKMLYFSAVSDIKAYPHLKFKTVLLACYNMDALKEFIWSKTRTEIKAAA
ncbi:MAG: GNAT family N-acetyltransferase [Gammaproteobacteria bacterium]|nr:GNAT family N-acetyltransferase [Gammaproteobacteria bacterium]